MSQTEATAARSSARQSWSAAVLAVLITALWWADGLWRGILGIARVDDWSYLRTAFDFAETGTLTLNGWVHMNFIGQALLALPIVRTFGESPLALQLLVGCFSVALLYLVYLLAREVLHGYRALIPVFVVGLSPIFGLLSVTFMTDMPAAAFMTLSLVLGIRAMRSERFHWVLVLLSLVAALAAFSIREFGILAALPTVIMIAYRVRQHTSDLVRIVGLSLGIAVLVAGIWIWRSHLPNQVLDVAVSPAEWLSMAAGALLVVGFLMSPIALTVSPRRWLRTPVRSRWLVVASSFAMVVLIAFLAQWDFVGNIIFAYGSTSTSLGGGVPTYPLGIDRLLRFAAVVSLFVMVVVALGWISTAAGAGTRLRAQVGRLAQAHAPATTMALFVGLLGAAYLLGPLIVGSPLFDRYALPLIGPLSALMIAALIRTGLVTRARFRPGQAIALAIYGTVSFIYVDTAAQVDGARWAIAKQISESEGIPARYIDGGDPWFRYHQVGAGKTGPIVPGRPWWTTFFPNSVVCRTITLTTSQSLESYYGEPILVRSHERLIGDPFALTVYPGPDACPGEP